MASITDFLGRLFNGGRKTAALNDEAVIASFKEPAVAEFAALRIAITTAINMIAGTLSGCEFQTYRAGEVSRDFRYHLWNIAPNPNENAAHFLRKLVWKLCTENECLVLFEGGHAYIADYFTQHQGENFRDSNKYEVLTVNGLDFNGTYTAGEVCHFRLNDSKDAVGKLPGKVKTLTAAITLDNGNDVELKLKRQLIHDNATLYPYHLSRNDKNALRGAGNEPYNIIPMNRITKITYTGKTVYEDTASLAES